MKKITLTLLAVVMVSVALAQSKTVSILGDSYSTYEDFVTPATNELWYYAKNAAQKTDVKNVRQTWWHQVIKENGWRLAVNNSYSGATISYTGYDGNDYSPRSFNTRMDNLGQPDIILQIRGYQESRPIRVPSCTGPHVAVDDGSVCQYGNLFHPEYGTQR